MASGVKVTTNRTTLKVEIGRAAAANPDVREQLKRHFSRWQGRELADVVGDHYKEVFVQATRIIASGAPNAERGRNISIATRFGIAAMGFWAALSFKYMKDKAREYPLTSDKWWTRRSMYKGAAPLRAPAKKGGKPRKGRVSKRRTTLQVASAASSALTKTAGGNYRNAATLTKVKAAQRKGNLPQVAITANIGLKPTGNAMLDFIARTSFIRGQSVWTGVGKAQVEGADDADIVIAATDQRRPLISRLAAALGQQAVEALSKMKI